MTDRESGRHAIFETDRLAYFKPKMSDAESMFDAYASKLDVTRYMGWPTHQSVDETEAFIEFSEQIWSDRGTGPLLIRDRQTGELLGSTGLDMVEPQLAMTGYVLKPESWGLGYATESLLGVLDYANRFELVKIIALCHPSNTASLRVLIKCGFAHAGQEEFEFPNMSEKGLGHVLRYEYAMPAPVEAAAAGNQ